MDLSMKIATVFAIIAVMFTANAGAACNKPKMHACVQTFADSMNNSTMIVDSLNLNVACKSVDIVDTCVKKAGCSKADVDRTEEYAGAVDGYQFMCSQDRASILKIVQCLITVEQSYMEKCYNKTVVPFITNTKNFTEVAYCKVMNEMLACQDGVVKSHCGVVAATTYLKWNLISLKPTFSKHYYSCVLDGKIKAIKPTTEKPPCSTGSSCRRSCLSRKGNGVHQSCRGCKVYAKCIKGVFHDNIPCAVGKVWDNSKHACIKGVSKTCHECKV